MSQFEAKVKATLDMGTIDSEISKVGKKPIKFTNISFDTSRIAAQLQAALSKPLRLSVSSIDTSKLNAELSNVGTTTGKNITTGISRSMGSGSRLRQLTRGFKADLEKATSSINTHKIDADLSSVKAKFESISRVKDHAFHGQIEKNIAQLKVMQGEMAKIDSTTKTGAQDLVDKYREYNDVLATTKNMIKTVTSETGRLASETQIASSQNKMTAFLESGTKAAKKYGEQVRHLRDELSNLNNKGYVKESDLKRINGEFTNIQQRASAAGENVKTFGSRLKTAFSRLTSYISASTIIYGTVRAVRAGVNEVVELDNALVDLKKTSDGTTQQLNDFYYSANDSAKQLGTSTKDVIQAAADWSRLGYSIKDAETMAKVSSIFKSISPGMDIQKANDGLISSMKAFKIEASDALDAVASKINIVGNTQAVSNADIVEILTRSSSAMAEANNTLDETIAVGTAATEITRNAEAVGTALKTEFCLYV